MRRVPEPKWTRLHRVARLGEFQLSRFAHVKSEHDEWAHQHARQDAVARLWLRLPVEGARRRRPAAAAVRLSQRRVRFIDGDELRLGRPEWASGRVGEWARGRVGEWASGRVRA